MASTGTKVLIVPRIIRKIMAMAIKKRVLLKYRLRVNAIIVASMGTRSSNETSLGSQVGNQFKMHPKAVYIAATVLYIFAVIPGLPKFPFLVIGSVLFVIGYTVLELEY